MAFSMKHRFAAATATAALVTGLPGSVLGVRLRRYNPAVMQGSGVAAGAGGAASKKRARAPDAGADTTVLKKHKEMEKHSIDQGRDQLAALGKSPSIRIAFEGVEGEGVCKSCHDVTNPSSFGGMRVKMLFCDEPGMMILSKVAEKGGYHIKFKKLELHDLLQDGQETQALSAPFLGPRYQELLPGAESFVCTKVPFMAILKLAQIIDKDGPPAGGQEEDLIFNSMQGAYPIAELDQVNTCHNLILGRHWNEGAGRWVINKIPVYYKGKVTTPVNVTDGYSARTSIFRNRGHIQTTRIYMMGYTTFANWGEEKEQPIINKAGEQLVSLEDVKAVTAHHSLRVLGDANLNIIDKEDAFSLLGLGALALEEKIECIRSVVLKIEGLYGPDASEPLRKNNMALSYDPQQSALGKTNIMDEFEIWSKFAGLESAAAGGDVARVASAVNDWIKAGRPTPAAAVHTIFGIPIPGFVASAISMLNRS